MASQNKLAKEEGGGLLCFGTGRFFLSTANLIAVSDIAQGYTELNTTPHT